MSQVKSPARVKSVRKNDEVIVLTGKDRGKRGRVLQVLPERNRVVVEGVNMVKRHTKPNPQKNVKGGIVEREGSIMRRTCSRSTRKRASRRGSDGRCWRMAGACASAAAAEACWTSKDIS
jgi:ribosomal protein L24